ncbi:hypothetical protein AWB68_02616 [Caballeronia choica]|jgi:hypothetical protein|uniref:Uncharacterized protein n=1 Tax=Caballeronia choica TaxID=326476 RepID=A0A158IDZ2_9BURK|nr:hypothetical protein AWB68_02616 [Caballeronia choica]
MPADKTIIKATIIGARAEEPAATVRSHVGRTYA